MSQDTPEVRFVKRMRTERAERGWSQERLVKEVAERTGFRMNPTVITKLEWATDPARRDKARGLGFDEALAIAQTFQLSVSEMVEPQDRISELDGAIRATEGMIQEQYWRRADAEDQAKKKLDEIDARIEQLRQQASAYNEERNALIDEEIGKHGHWVGPKASGAKASSRRGKH
jgi:transcriptional regulator with XRE-family HTH domain